MVPGGKSPYLLLDGVSPHTCLKARTRYRDLKIGVLPHPPHSPDLSPTDYCIIKQYDNYRHERPLISRTYEGARDHFLSFLRGLTPEYLASGIDELPLRWKACVASKGNYFTDFNNNAKNLNTSS